MPRLKGHFYITILFCFWILNSQAQDHIYSVKQWETEDGLNDREVNTVLEDNQGLMWIGTKSGIQRFDGHEFMSWGRSDSKNLVDITKVGIDDANWLWMWNSDIHEFVFLNTKSFEIKTQAEHFDKDFPIVSLRHNGHWIFNEDRINRNSKDQLVFILSQPNRIVRFNKNNGFIYKSI